MDIEKVLGRAGVAGLQVESFDLHGQPNCFVLTVGKSSTPELWQKFRAVTEETGYYPVFAANDELEKWNFEAEFDGMGGFMQMAHEQNAQQDLSTHLAGFADAANQNDAIRETILKQYGMSAATPDQLNEPLTLDKFEMAARNEQNPMARNLMADLFNSPGWQDMKKNADKGIGPKMQSMNELIAQQAERMAAIANMFAGLPNMIASHNALKKFEQESLAQHREGEKRPSLDELVSAGEGLDLDKWIQLKRAERNAEVGDFTKDKWPNAQAAISNKLLLLPIKKCWMVPAILRLGGWEENPPAQVHVSMLKRWDEKFGIDVITVGFDTLYLKVRQPVTAKEIALQVASEQFAYCPDNVLQGSGDGTISGLAIDLVDRDVWEFWWD